MQGESERGLSLLCMPAEGGLETYWEAVNLSGYSHFVLDVLLINILSSEELMGTIANKLGK